MEADAGGYVSQPSSCCISSGLVNCKCVGIHKQRNQKNLTTLMHRKGGENGRNLVWFLSWEVGPTLTLISAPPVAFLWVPKHTLVSHVPSVCLSCPHGVGQEGNLHQSIFLAQQFPHGKHWGSPSFSLLAQIPFNLFPCAHACTISLAKNLPSFMLCTE